MGCWNETCALTNTPISYGMKNVKLVVFEPNSYFKPKEDGTDPWESQRDYESRRMVEGGEQTLKTFVGVFTGEYDDYGRIICADLPGDFDTAEGKYRTFFVNGNAWNATVEFVKAQIALPEEYDGWEYKRIIKGFEVVSAGVNAMKQMLEMAKARRDPSASLPSTTVSLYPEGREEIFKELLYILAILNFTRRDPWVGDLSRGSQATNYDAHAMLARETLKITTDAHEEIEASNSQGEL